MSLELYLAFIGASVVITVIPGPTVSLVVGNSLTHGTRAGLLNVAGTQLALAGMMLVLVLGLSSVVATMGGCSTGCAGPAPPISSISAGRCCAARESSTPRSPRPGRAAGSSCRASW